MYGIDGMRGRFDAILGDDMKCSGELTGLDKTDLFEITEFALELPRDTAC